ncbi:unnamed protein product [Brassicogethes aeneus]|uniref:Uncharacterized protein n=1 Tax=Brassicogethes aeneus TaxID=1431903 RepID=A0A9P0AYC1_BRAAE|nr:unnamed protein product [Brassicogethes aeneus]
MHQDSDIFCLRDTKAGENDGRGIFSSNGSCSMRTNKKPNVYHEDAFQYGSSTKTNYFANPVVEREDGMQERKVEVAPERVPEPAREEEVVEPVEPVEVMEDDVVLPKAEVENANKVEETEAEFAPEVVLEQDTCAEEVEPVEVKKSDEVLPKLKKKTVYQKANGVDEKVSSSTILRNPLTGAGMEGEELKDERKHMKSKTGKWIW